MIFVDPSVPMYLVGAAHPNKGRAMATLTRPVRDRRRFITDAAVYREILHRRKVIRRPDAIDATPATLGN